MVNKQILGPTEHRHLSNLITKATRVENSVHGTMALTMAQLVTMDIIVAMRLPRHNVKTNFRCNASMKFKVISLFKYFNFPFTKRKKNTNKGFNSICCQW